MTETRKRTRRARPDTTEDATTTYTLRWRRLFGDTVYTQVFNGEDAELQAKRWLVERRRLQAMVVVD